MDNKKIVAMKQPAIMLQVGAAGGVGRATGAAFDQQLAEKGVDAANRVRCLVDPYGPARKALASDMASDPTATVINEDVNFYGDWLEQGLITKETQVIFFTGGLPRGNKTREQLAAVNAVPAYLYGKALGNALVALIRQGDLTLDTLPRIVLTTNPEMYVAEKLAAGIKEVFAAADLVFPANYEIGLGGLDGSRAGRAIIRTFALKDVTIERLVTRVQTPTGIAEYEGAAPVFGNHGSSLQILVELITAITSDGEVPLVELIDTYFPGEGRYDTGDLTAYSGDDDGFSAAKYLETRYFKLHPDLDDLREAAADEGDSVERPTPTWGDVVIQTKYGGGIEIAKNKRLRDAAASTPAGSSTINRSVSATKEPGELTAKLGVLMTAEGQAEGGEVVVAAYQFNGTDAPFEGATDDEKSAFKGLFMQTFVRLTANGAELVPVELGQESKELLVKQARALRASHDDFDGEFEQEKMKPQYQPKKD